MNVVAPAAILDPSRKRLAQQYVDVRSTTETLCARLTAEDQMVQPMADASPTKWHQAHTTWFFETFILTPYLPDYRPLDPQYRYLFNSYYKQLGGHPLRSLRGMFSRPTLQQVQQYREHVDIAMARLLASDIAGHPEVEQLVTLGINHEQQHQELIVTDIKYTFWSNPLRPAYFSTPIEELRGEAAPLRWHDFGGGVQSVGFEGDGFSFDNEGPRHQIMLRPYRLSSRLVTNAEYLDFVNERGYERPELWLSDGWDTVVANHWNSPLYWEQRDGAWVTFTAGGMREVRQQEPVCHVSYYEADAYARWAGARLATEAEWEVAASQFPITDTFLEDGRFHPSAAIDVGGLLQIFGDVWEWTGSSYGPYPGFRPAEGALGEYNGKFMCSQMVLRGGSCVTPRSHIRATYRNFFPPSARWQFSGIRLAKDQE